MTLLINGGYSAYVYLALLMLCLFFLQRLAHNRNRSTRRGSSATANVLIDLYCTLTALVASILSWGTWLLAIYVGYHFGLVSGVAFFVVSIVATFVLPLLLPPYRGVDAIAHIMSIPASIYLVVRLLVSVGLID